MASTKFEGLNISIPESPDLASLYGQFQRPWPLDRRVTLPAYDHNPEDASDEQELPSGQISAASDNKGEAKTNLQLPPRAYTLNDLGYSAFDYHKALRTIWKKELRELRTNQRNTRALAIDTDYYPPSSESTSSSKTLEQTPSEASKDKNTDKQELSLGEAIHMAPPWDSSTTMVSLSGLSTPSLHSAPDGGLNAWLQAIAGFFVAFNCWGLPMAFGVLEPFYRSFYIDYTVSQIAWIGSMQLALLFLVAPIVNTLYDRGAFRLMFHGGTLVLLIATLATTWCQTWLTTFIVQGLVAGCAMGTICCAYTRVLRGWFGKNLGIAMAIVAAGASAGGIIYSLTIAHLLSKAGFAWTYRALMGIILATMIFPNLVITPCPDDQTKTPAKPPSTSSFLNFSYLLMLLGMFLSFWPLFFPYIYITSYATTALSLPPNHIPTFLLTLLAATLPGRVLPSLLSGYLPGPLTTLILPTLLSATLSFLFLTAPHHQPTLHLLAALYGFSSACTLTLYAPTALAFARPPAADFVLVTHSGQREGGKAAEGAAPLRVGVVLATIGVAVMTGVPVGARLVEVGVERRGAGVEGFKYAWVWAGVCWGLAGICFLGSRVARVGWRGGRV